MKKRSYGLICTALLMTGAQMPAVSGAAESEPAQSLQSYLLTKSRISDADDMDGNGVLNAVDLTLLKRKLLHAVPLICINEVCTSNSDSYIAADGSSPDWVEIYNAADTPQAIGGYGLSDKKSERCRFVFPAETVIPAHGFLLVLCDGGSGTMHAPFKLSASGETVYLTAPKNSDGSDGAAVDTATVLALDPDTTYGRVPDGGSIRTRLHASAGTSNDSAGQVSYIAAPFFSKDAGFYDSAFDLVLTAPADCQIFYTTDGSDPRSSATAGIYENAVRIYDNSNEPNIASAFGGISSVTNFVPDQPVEKGMIIRAVCKDGAGNFSRVMTNGYYIGKTAPYYRSLRVISIATDTENLFDPEKGIYLQKNCMERGREWEIPVHIQVYENSRVSYSEDVGMRIAGNWSRNYPQKSLTFYARSDYGSSKMKYDFFGGGAKDCSGKTIIEFDKVTLRNGGDGYDCVRFRDDLNADLAAGLDIGTQAKYDYIAFINGEFWGCYSMQEKLDDEYLESHYHVPKENITTIKNTLGEGDARICADYFAFFKWAKDADFSGTANYTQFSEKMDVQSLIDWIAAESIVCNWDSLINVNNTMIWRANQTDASNPYADGKWRFLFFDTEYSSGFSWTDAEYNFLANMDCFDQPNCFGTLFYNLMRNPKFAAQFHESYMQALEQHFTKERAFAQIDRYAERLSAVSLAAAERFGIDMNAEKQAAQNDVLRDFWARRGGYAAAHCEECMQKYRTD